MPDSEPIFGFALPNGRGPKSFYTLEEFETWFIEQQRWWQTLGPQNLPQEAHQKWTQFEASVRQQLIILKNPNTQAQQRQQANQQIRNNLGHYNNGSLPEAESPEARIVSSYHQKQPALGYGFLASIATPMTNLQGRDPLFWSGFLLGSLHRVGMLKETAVDFDYLSSVERDWRERFEKLHADTTTANGDSQQTLDAIKQRNQTEAEENKDHREAVDAELSQRRQDLEELFQKTSKDWAEVLDKYNRQLAFRAPVTYWKRKASGHGIAACILAVAWLIAGCLSVYGIFQFIAPYLKPDAKIDYQHGALVLLLSGFAIWLMRILTRLFLSSVHQQSDSAQRKTMVETYLALEAEGKLTEEQRTMIIEAMFRPVTMGVVKEDETPSHPFSALSKIVGRD
jgi:Family of unknown function (DUF6161)